MSIGQMNTMAQVPMGAVLPIAASTPLTAATAPVGDQDAGDSFAGMLFGMSQQTPGQQ